MLGLYTARNGYILKIVYLDHPYTRIKLQKNSSRLIYVFFYFLRPDFEAPWRPEGTAHQSQKLFKVAISNHLFALELCTRTFLAPIYNNPFPDMYWNKPSFDLCWMKQLLFNCVQLISIVVWDICIPYICKKCTYRHADRIQILKIIIRSR